MSTAIFDGALQRQLAAVVQHLAEQAAVHPLHHHVDLAAVVVGQHLHDAGVVQLLADFGLALEAIVKHGIGFHLRMRNLDRDLAAVAHIGGAKNGRHAAAGDKSFNAVVVELIAGMECHVVRENARQGGLQSSAACKAVPDTFPRVPRFELGSAERLYYHCRPDRSQGRPAAGPPHSDRRRGPPPPPSPTVPPNDGVRRSTAAGRRRDTPGVAGLDVDEQIRAKRTAQNVAR